MPQVFFFLVDIFWAGANRRALANIKRPILLTSFLCMTLERQTAVRFEKLKEVLHNPVLTNKVFAKTTPLIGSHLNAMESIANIVPGKRA